MTSLALSDADPDRLMVELDPAEIDMVSGGVSDDAVYGASVGVAVGMFALAVGAAPILAAGGMALILGGSIAASGVAIYTVLQ